MPAVAAAPCGTMRPLQGLPGHWSRAPLAPQLTWFSYLGIKDMAECSAVCKSWLVYVNKAYAAEFRAATGVPAPMMLPRLDKLFLLAKVRRPLARDHFTWLLTMAAGKEGG